MVRRRLLNTEQPPVSKINGVGVVSTCGLACGVVQVTDNASPGEKRDTTCCMFSIF